MKDCCKNIITPFCPTCGDDCSFNVLSEREQIATILHKHFCTYDHHTEECAWSYEKDWDKAEHISYLIKARRLLEVLEIDDILMWIEKFKDIKIEYRADFRKDTERR